MTTLVRAEISEKNKYWISKHRHYELKHFCLQYPTWKKEYEELEDSRMSVSKFEMIRRSNIPSDPTGGLAAMKIYCYDKIKLIEKTAQEADSYLYEYILRAVTEGLSYTYLKARLGIPCSKDTYYDRYRRFFWLLSNSRN